MAGSYKLPNDTFVVANQKENNAISDYNAQFSDPMSSIKQAYRNSLFSATTTDVSERLAEVMAVDMMVKKPSDLNYFGVSEVATEYGDRDWISTICRVMDFHSGVPEPSQLVIDNTTTQTFGDITKLRASVGKFYAPADDIRAKGATNIEVGDWLIVEFQDKTLLSNGIIKDVYLKRNKATLGASGGSFAAGSASGAFTGVLPTFASAGPPDINNPPLSQEYWTLLTICLAEGGPDPSGQGMADVAQGIYNRYYFNTQSRGSRGPFGGGPSIAGLVAGTGAFEPVIVNQTDWKVINDAASAIRAFINYRRIRYGENRTEASVIQDLARAAAALSDPNMQASAAAWVGLRTDWLAAAPTYEPQKAGDPDSDFEVERTPLTKHNNFHRRYDNSLREKIAPNGVMAAAAPIPQHILQAFATAGSATTAPATTAPATTAPATTAPATTAPATTAPATTGTTTVHILQPNAGSTP